MAAVVEAHVVVVAEAADKLSMTKEESHLCYLSEQAILCG